MSTLEEGILVKIPKIKESSYPSHTEFVNFENESNLPKDILFFACTSCNGPLVPTTTCIFCKRTFLRKYEKCGKNRYIQSHQACKILIAFGNSVTRKFTNEANI